MSTADAIRQTLISPNVADRNIEPANVVDVLNELGYKVAKVATAISADVAPGHDAGGGHVSCLTEAVMGMTAGLFAIAEAINNHAQHTE